MNFVVAAPAALLLLSFLTAAEASRRRQRVKHRTLKAPCIKWNIKGRRLQNRSPLAAAGNCQSAYPEVLGICSLNPLAILHSQRELHFPTGTDRPPSWKTSASPYLEVRCFPPHIWPEVLYFSQIRAEMMVQQARDETGFNNQERGFQLISQRKSVFRVARVQ